MAGQWRRQTRGQQQIGAGAGQQPVANVFDAIKLVGADPTGTPDANTLYKAMIPKARIQFNMATDAIAGSFNVSSITDGATGVDAINWNLDFLNDDYSIAPVVNRTSGGADVINAQSFAVGSVQIVVAAALLGVLTDSTIVTIIASGDQ